MSDDQPATQDPDLQEDEEEAQKDEATDDSADPPKKRAKKASPAKGDKEKDAKGGKKKKKAARKHPKTIEMIVEAIDNMNEKQGSSVQAIKAYIIQNFKTVRTDIMLKIMLKRAFSQGLAQNVLVRPKGQNITQLMSGRYLLGKSAFTDDDEVMPQKSKRAKDAMLQQKKSQKGKKKKKKSGAKRPSKKSSPKKRRR